MHEQRQIGALSLDGWWRWSGHSWEPAVSPDGCWVWDGHAWQRRGASAARQRRWEIVIAAAVTPVALVLVGLVGVDAWLMHVGCGSIDPTDPSNYSTISIRNDTARSVIVTDCRGTYCFGGPSALAHGRSKKVNAACAASGPDATSWRLTDTAGTTVGYIAVSTPRKRDGLIYLVSRSTARRELAATPIVPRRPAP